MTREEAIQAFKVYRNCLFGTLAEPIDMAIKVLEQEPSKDMKEITEIMKCDADAETKCKMISEIVNGKPHYFKEQEPCSDAISRQAVLVSIKNLYPDMPIMDIMGARRKWLEKYAPYFECENEIERLPSVNPQPKTGHWINKEHRKEQYVLIGKCSVCGRVRVLDEFCSNCGARMESEG